MFFMKYNMGDNLPKLKKKAVGKRNTYSPMLALLKRQTKLLGQSENAKRSPNQ